MKERKMKIEANEDKITMEIEGNPSYIGSTAAQIVAKFINVGSELDLDEDEQKAFGYTILSMAINEAGVDIDDFYKKHKQKEELKAKMNKEEENIKDEIIKGLEGLRDLLKDLAQK